MQDIKEVQQEEVATNEEMLEMLQTPKVFSTLIGVNGNQTFDIKCDKEFTDWDLLSVARTIEAVVLDRIMKREGITQEEVGTQIAYINHFRREDLGRVVEHLSKGNEFLIRAITDADLFEKALQAEANNTEVELIKPTK